MKRLMLFTLYWLAASALQAQEPDCKRVKNGNFRSVLQQEGTDITVYINRKNNTQTEEIKETGLKMKFTVEWKDACTYTLSNPKVVKGKLPGVNPSEVLTITILDVQDDAYTVQVSSSLYPGKTEFDIFIEK